ncbi:latexin-like [Erpetoichthys calabaricus]|uniref:latexin-like n=1 Tax=Erpetoichthys calabaricus TaxID=27687 RepID=UPI0022349911|nr:latexin-like [Erpetoichthys calabaricus]
MSLFKWVVLGLLPLINGFVLLNDHLQSSEMTRTAMDSENLHNELPYSTLHLEEAEAALEKSMLLNTDLRMEKLNPANYRATRAAQVAVHYLNYKQGSLFCHFSRRKIENATLEEISGVGNKYFLTFTEDETPNKHATGVHTAEILFRHTITKMAPEVNSTYNGCVKNISEDENTFYVRMRKQHQLVAGKYIPDGHGNIPIEMEPFWHLGYTASSYIMWKESNESTLFNMETVLSFQQLETENDSLAFDYVVLLHEMVSQEVTQWTMQVCWSPFQGVKVLHYSQSSENIQFPGDAKAIMTPASLDK